MTAKNFDALFDGSDAHLLAGPTGENALSGAEALTAAGGSPATFEAWCRSYFGDVLPVDVERIRLGWDARGHHDARHESPQGEK